MIIPLTCQQNKIEFVGQLCRKRTEMCIENQMKQEVQRELTQFSVKIGRPRKFIYNVFITKVNNKTNEIIDIEDCSSY